MTYTILKTLYKGGLHCTEMAPQQCITNKLINVI